MAKGERCLRLVTLNLLNDARRWSERAALAANGLASLEPDVIALQEVRLEVDQAGWLAKRLGGLEVAICSGAGPRAGREGLAILSRWPIQSQERLEFGRQGRVAQKVRVDHPSGQWTIANVHLHWGPWADRVRQAQVRQVLGWLEPGRSTVLCGDLNALPHQPSVDLLRDRFIWAAPRGGRAARDGLATATFPTPLWRGPGIRHGLRRASLLAAGLLLQGRCGPWEATLDYIFVDRTVEVIASAVVLDRPAPYDERLCASDHCAVSADLAHGCPRGVDGRPLIDLPSGHH